MDFYIEVSQFCQISHLPWTVREGRLGLEVAL